MKSRSIKVEDIRIGDGRRSVDATTVDRLAVSIEKDGLMAPIGVEEEEGGYLLIWGHHRLRAHKKIGRTRIEARVYEGPLDDDERSYLREVENAFRKELTVAERAAAIRRINDYLEARGQRAQRGRQASDADVTTTAQLAEEHGVSSRTIARLEKIGRSIPRDVLELIQDTDYADSTTLLIELSRISSEDSKRSLAQEIKDRGPMSVKEAKALIAQRRREGEASDQREAEPGTATFTHGDFAVVLKGHRRGTVDVFATAPRDGSLETWATLNQQMTRLLRKDGVGVLLVEPEQLQAAWPRITKDLHVRAMHSVSWRDAGEGSDWTLVLELSKTAGWRAACRYVMTKRSFDRYQALFDQLFAELDVAGKFAIDPMCAEGAIVVAASRAGANALGIDADAGAIEAAQAHAG